MAQGWLKSIVTGFAFFFALAFFSEPVAFAKAGHREGSLGVIVEKDLFRPSRNKPRPPKAVPKPPPAPVVVLPPPKSPPPRLTLSGTILLDSGSEALMSLQSAPSGSGRYRVGDEIEGFVITDILGESVVLKRDDEVLKVYMNSGQGGFQNASGFPQARQNIAVQSGAPSDIPPALVPRPQSPFQRAPYRQNTGSR
ncbi:MAG: hypothetical protein HYV23_04350 [Deltaproteobacteria bacterium]|nr:hypothetical protein [Deltaproteobacteria bacterium]